MTVLVNEWMVLWRDGRGEGGCEMWELGQPYRDRVGHDDGLDETEARVSPCRARQGFALCLKGGAMRRSNPGWSRKLVCSCCRDESFVATLPG